MIWAFLKIIGAFLTLCSLAIVVFFLLCLIPESDDQRTKNNKD
jgi:hypothetical protein